MYLRAADVCGRSRPACKSAKYIFRGWRIRNAPIKRRATKGATTEKAIATAATSGSNNIPHEPCSFGSAMPRRRTLGRATLGEDFTGNVVSDAADIIISL